MKLPGGTSIVKRIGGTVSSEVLETVTARFLGSGLLVCMTSNCSSNLGSLYTCFDCEQVWLRLSNWVRLANKSVEAEIPHYEMLRSMAMFLDSKLNADQMGDEVVKRLAIFFECPEEARLS